MCGRLVMRSVNMVVGSLQSIVALGVALWEIMTLGNQPYKDVKGRELLSLLKGGHRLPVPFACSKGVYSIMLQCESAIQLSVVLILLVLVCVSISLLSRCKKGMQLICSLHVY